MQQLSNNSQLALSHSQPTRVLPGAMRVNWRSPTPVRQVVNYKKEAPVTEQAQLSDQLANLRPLALTAGDTSQSSSAPPWKKKKTWLPGAIYRAQIAARGQGSATKGGGKGLKKGRCKSNKK